MTELSISFFSFINHRKESLIIILLLLTNIWTVAQNNGLPKITLPSPEAASLGKYGDVQVGHYTGVPSISVPFYDIKIDNLNVPIFLSYHSGGIKVEENASNSGLAWTLNAGGVITHSIRGLDDFSPLGNGFVRNIDILPAQLVPLDMNKLRNQPDYDLCKRVAKGELDSEPDIFYYNFIGRSGKFFFDRMGNAHTIPFSKLQIKFSPTGRFFTIKDEAGNLFEFSKTEIALHNAPPGCTDGSGGIYEYSQENISYYLSKILTLKKDSINFVYGKYSFTYENSNVEQDYTRYSSPLLCSSIPPKISCNSKTQVLGIRVSQINVPSQQLEINFNYSSADRLDLPGSNALSSIEIKRDVKILKTFSLNYDYFISDGLSSAPLDKRSTFYRLKLQSVTESGKKPYYFDYSPVVLPNRFSKAQDWWGYYNGDETAVSLLPKAEIEDISLLGYGPRTIPGALRKPNKDFMGASLLNKIKYPTGGETTFEFEPHDFYKESKLILWNTGSATVHINENESDTYSKAFEVYSSLQNRRNFRILYNNSVAGFQNLTNVYISGPNNYFLSLEGPCPAGGFPLAFPNPGIYSLNIYGNGTHNGEFATVLWEDKTIQPQAGNFISGGMRIKKIINNDKITSFSQSKIYDYSLPSNILRSSGIIMHDLDYKYFTHDMQLPKIIPSSQNDERYLLCRNLVRYGTSPLALGQLNGSSVAYEYVTVKELGLNGSENGKVEHKFLTMPDLGSYLQYPYPSPIDYDWMRGQATWEKSFRKNNDASYTLLKQINYQYNFNHTSSFYGGLNNNNNGVNETIVRTPKIANRNGAFNILNNSSQNVEILADFVIEYTQLISAWPYKSKEEIISYDQNGLNPLTTENYFFYSNPSHIQLSRVETVNSKRAILSTEIKYPHDFAGTAVYDSMIARNIITPIIEQKNYNNTTLLSQTKTNYALWNIEKFALPQTVQTSKLINPLETELTYDSYDNKGNLLQYTAKDLVLTSFVWGYKQQYPISKIVGATYTQVLTALGQSDLNLTYLQNLSGTALITELNKIRNNLQVINPKSLVTTYTYDPLVGMTSQTDFNGNVTYYEYDNLQRLSVIRDQDKNILKTYNYNYASQ